MEVGGVAELREDGEDVAFGEGEGEAGDMDEGGGAVVGVPGCGGRGAVVEFELV